MSGMRNGMAIGTGLLIAGTALVAGCKGGGVAPRIPALQGKAEEIYFQESEVITLKEGPEGVRATGAIK